MHVLFNRTYRQKHLAAICWNIKTSLMVYGHVSSLLHVEKADLSSELQNLVQALRVGGTLYMSLKEGASNVPDGGRHFSYFNKCEVEEIVDCCSGLELDSLWIAESEDCTWLNTVAKRV